MQIAKAFSNLQFKMIGDGDMLEDLKSVCMEENINNIKFYGRIPNSQVYQEMQESDLLLMTSEYEGLPKVIQEAAQMRLPSIYTVSYTHLDVYKRQVYIGVGKAYCKNVKSSRITKH